MAAKLSQKADAIVRERITSLTDAINDAIYTRAQVDRMTVAEVLGVLEGCKLEYMQRVLEDQKC